MRIQVTSDLHFEFHPDNGKSFINSMDPSECDALVVAGDLNVVMGNMWDSIGMLCKRYEGKPVYYVAGNHDYYHGDPAIVSMRLADFESEFENFVWMDYEKHSMLGSTSIGGCTLWFDAVLNEGNKYDFYHMSDSQLIDTKYQWFLNENKTSKEFLSENCEGVDVIVTHHMPSDVCIAEQFEGNHLNKFFVCDITDIIEKIQPKYWICGHTHSPFRKKVGETEIICNAYGYPHEPKDEYESQLILEI
jgi:Icc-related predicted phosphoesterase